MKNIFTLMCLCLLASIYGQDEISFIHDEYQKALTDAAKSNKIIMIDAFTTWCGPCKMMSNGTFKEKSTADFYNQNFINLKLDMEKGTNPALGIKFNVRAYPTIIFINSKENIIYKHEGYLDGAAFLELGNEVLSGKKDIPKLLEAYKKGNKSPEKTYELAKAKASIMDADASEYAYKYLKTQKDWTSQINQELIILTCGDVQSKMFEYVISNQEKLKKAYGEGPINRLIESSVSKYVNANPPPKIKNVEKVFQLVYPKEYKQTTGKYQMGITRSKGDKEGYAKAAVDYFKKFDKDAEELNEAALTFYKVVDKPKMLKKAIEWAEMAIKIDNSIDNLNTLAALYIKTNQIDTAKKILNSSLTISTKAKSENPFADELLQSLNSPKSK
jgi:thioredoxin-related protein